MRRTWTYKRKEKKIFVWDEFLCFESSCSFFVKSPSLFAWTQPSCWVRENGKQRQTRLGRRDFTYPWGGHGGNEHNRLWKDKHSRFESKTTRERKFNQVRFRFSSVFFSFSFQNNMVQCVEIRSRARFNWLDVWAKEQVNWLLGELVCWRISLLETQTTVLSCCEETCFGPFSQHVSRLHPFLWKGTEFLQLSVPLVSFWRTRPAVRVLYKAMCRLSLTPCGGETGAVVAAQLLCRDKELVVSGLTSLCPWSLRVAWQVSDATRNPVFLFPVIAKIVHESVFVGDAAEQRLLFVSIVQLCTDLKSATNKKMLIDLRRAGAVMALQSKQAIDLCALCKGTFFSSLLGLGF